MVCFAKLRDVAVLALVLVGLMVAVGCGSDPAAEAMERGDQAQAAGDLTAAAGHYRDAYRAGETDQKEAAWQKIEDIWTSVEIESAPIDEQIEVWRIVDALQDWRKSKDDAHVDRALAMLRQQSAADPATRLAWLTELQAARGAALGASLRIKLLEDAVDAHPEESGYLEELALHWEAEDDREALKALLVPRRERLGATEAARLLGYLLLMEEDRAGAVEQWRPYVADRADRYKQAREEYADQLASLYELYLDQLRAGDAGEGWYTRYDLADEQDQSVMVDEWIGERLRAHRGLNNAARRVRELSPVVSVGFDLGLTLLAMVPEASTPAEQEALLAEAERVLLNFEEEAEDAEGLRFRLAQVSFWLGKVEKGRNLLAGIVEANAENAPVLTQVAQTYRNVGLDERAMELAEKAWEVGQTDEEKWEAASIRAVYWGDIEERIKWLERCNPHSISTRADLQDAYGDRARSVGEIDKAIKHYKESVALYDKQAESATVLNNAAIVCRSLYFLTEDQAYLDKMIDLMDKAAALSPESRIVFDNLASFITDKILLDVADDRIDFQSLEWRPSFEMVYMLASDAREHQRLIDAITGHELYPKLISARERVILLANQDRNSWYAYGQLLSVVRDAQRMERLCERARQMDFPLDPESVAEVEALLAGENDAIVTEALPANRADAAALLSAIDREADPLSWAIARGWQVETELNAWSYGGEVDLDKLVTMAAESVAASDCYTSQHKHRRALAAAILGELLPKLNEDSAATVRKLNRVLSLRMVLAMLGRSDPAAAEMIRNASHAPSLLEAELKRLDRMGADQSPSEVTWLLLLTLDEQAARKIEPRLRGDRLMAAWDELAYLLMPSSLYARCMRPTQLASLGQTDAAKAAYEKAVADGFPMPPLKWMLP